ncbi:MaoC family dehydratase [Xanthobacter agilis]|jgi:acyl dehydratase|uniref:Acyl dehydratase n=1 Tax=Xanthobacter agilis TaxID=47492 RepID=A0ABU0LHW0_XANAG|nr:MaoC/PaaZ C-terminal domain-containing protein [Xanthobacter agilis]MDQ0506739.1 acyl dehydratase [Xanthobacter agilis]
MTANDAGYRRIGTGFHYEDLSIGMTFRTAGRTLTQADLSNFCNLTWMTEELFTDADHRADMALPAAVVPGALVYAFAEGLLLPMMQGTGLAFLEADVRVKGPTVVGDTLTVYCEVSEMRVTSRGDRGLVRTFNSVRRSDGTELLTYNPLRMLKLRGGWV